MTTLSNSSLANSSLANSSIENRYTDALPENTSMDAITAPMLTSAVRENAHQLLWITTKALAAFVMVGAFLFTLGDVIKVNFFAAWSAALAVLYIANLADVSRLRDAVSLTVPALFVWGVLAVGGQNAYLVGLALFTHLGVAFFASLARTSGSLKDSGIWSLLFGSSLAVMLYYVVYFLA